MLDFLNKKKKRAVIFAIGILIAAGLISAGLSEDVSNAVADLFEAILPE